MHNSQNWRIMKENLELQIEYPYNSVLKNKENYIEAIEKLEAINLPKHNCLAKNWDSLAALSIILKHTNRSAKILDAGGELYSTLLPKLAKLGYKKLMAMNLAFVGLKYFVKRILAYLKYGIIYKYGDITYTKLKDSYFDVVTCFSVIEHNVNPDAFFSEMSRILKRNGILFISTDYWNTDIDTHEVIEDGQPVKIYSPKDILGCIKIANKYGLYLNNELKFEAQDKVVNWKGIDFTFIYFTLVKK